MRNLKSLIDHVFSPTPQASPSLATGFCCTFRKICGHTILLHLMADKDGDHVDSDDVSPTLFLLNDTTGDSHQSLRWALSWKCHA